MPPITLVAAMQQARYHSRTGPLTSSKRIRIARIGNGKLLASMGMRMQSKSTLTPSICQSSSIRTPTLRMALQSITIIIWRSVGRSPPRLRFSRRSSNDDIDSPLQSSPECSPPCQGGDRGFKSHRGRLMDRIGTVRKPAKRVSSNLADLWVRLPLVPVGCFRVVFLTAVCKAVAFKL
jgi:hypothetical protein